MKWKEIKAQIEKQGVRDEDEVPSIEIRPGEDSINAIPLLVPGPRGSWHVESER